MGLMIAADTRFEPSVCVRCNAVTLTGRAAGLLWRVDSRAASVEHAAILKHYGVSVLALDVRLGGISGDFWSPGETEIRPGRYLAVPHVCGSANSDRQEKVS